MMHKRKIRNDPSWHGLLHGSRELRNRGGTTPFLKLSTKMVDLSLQHNHSNSVFTDIPAHLTIKSECYPLPKLQLPNASLVTTTQEQTKKASTLEQSRFVQASRELLRTSMSRISHHDIRIHALPLWTSRLGIVALALLTFGAVYGFRGYHQDSLKHHSQAPPALQPREKPVAQATSIASENPHRDAHVVTRSKSKSRRQHADYIAKDTYVYYGRDGKPSH